LLEKGVVAMDGLAALQKKTQKKSAKQKACGRAKTGHRISAPPGCFFLGCCFLALAA
jgi:hypothetical protein